MPGHQSEEEAHNEEGHEEGGHEGGHGGHGGHAVDVQGHDHWEKFAIGINAWRVRPIDVYVIMDDDLTHLCDVTVTGARIDASRLSSCIDLRQCLFSQFPHYQEELWSSTHTLRR